ncbi:MAG: NosD domain-containing protein [Candidatus Heimdallarchaeota archaeon]
MVILKAAVVFVSITLFLAFNGSLGADEPGSLSSSRLKIPSMFEPNNGLISQKPVKLVQNWNVTSSEVRTGEIIFANRVEVGENVSLTLNNCVLMINSTQDYIGKIVIIGSLILRDQTVIRAYDSSFGYRFFLFSTSTFEVSDSTIRDVGRNSPVSHDRGIHLNGMQTFLRNVTITNGWDGLIIATNHTVRVVNSRIVDNAAVGVRIEEQGGNAVLEYCTIEKNPIGLQIQGDSGNNTLRYSNLSSEEYCVGIFNSAYYNYQFGSGISPKANNSILENRITSHRTGISLQSSNNNTIIGNVISSESDGIILGSSYNNTISRNLIWSKITGFSLSFADYNQIDHNEIETSSIGTGISFEPGASGNLFQFNSIRFSKIGISSRGASPNMIIGNQIRDTQQVAISLELVKNGDAILSNELTAVSGFAMRMISSSLAIIEGNIITISSKNVPAIYLDDVENCSFISNQVTATGLAFHLVDSANIRFLENTVASISTSFLLADSLSKNVTVTVYDVINDSSLYAGSTLIMVPQPGMESEIASMTLYIDEVIFSRVERPNLKLVLDTFELGGGDFNFAVKIVYVNGTEADWFFSLTIHGRPRYYSGKTIKYETTSKTTWDIILTSFALGLLTMKSWLQKRRKK